MYILSLYRFPLTFHVRMLACRCSRDAQTGLVRRVTPFLRSCCRCPTPIRAFHSNSAHPLPSPALAPAPPPREGPIHSSPPECAFTHRLTSLTSSIPLPALPIFAVAQALPLPRSIFIFFYPFKISSDSGCIRCRMSTVPRRKCRSVGGNKCKLFFAV